MLYHDSICLSKAVKSIGFLLTSSYESVVYNFLWWIFYMQYLIHFLCRFLAETGLVSVNYQMREMGLEHKDHSENLKSKWLFLKILLSWISEDIFLNCVGKLRLKSFTMNWSATKCSRFLKRNELAERFMFCQLLLFNDTMKQMHWLGKPPLEVSFFWYAVVV